jgi:hypothetical protein
METTIKKTSDQPRQKNIAGMSMKGGKKDKFYTCLLEYYPDQERWFLKSLLQVKDLDDSGVGQDSDEAIRNWIEEKNLKKLVVDFPLSQPACQECRLDCPGVSVCPDTTVVDVRNKIEGLISQDARNNVKGPKEYERSRNEDDLYDKGRDIWALDSYQHLLSRSFKRRLKKGFTPYWNRPVDFWIWAFYYDQLLDVFNTSYDSFGNTSLMVISRFFYLKRHFPSDLELFEGNILLTLLELMRAGILTKSQLQSLSDLEEGVEARKKVIKCIEEKLNIFIYEADLDLVVKHPHAFDSFLLAISGRSIQVNKCHELPPWALPARCKLIVPNFKD